jgi:hypothetical protein
LDQELGHPFEGEQEGYFEGRMSEIGNVGIEDLPQIWMEYS